MRVTSVLPLRFVVSLQMILTTFVAVFSQTPSPTPDSRGIGVQSSTTQASSQAAQQAREAKPQLVLQTGYNPIFGSTRMVFSPDGRLLATSAYQSSSIKLWETATGRELRVLSTGVQGAAGISPAIAFSRDNRLVAAAAGGNTIKVWEVTSGREVQSLAGPQGSISTAIGMSFIGFLSNNQLVAISDAIRVWDINTGKELRALQLNTPFGALTGSEGALLSPNGDQLAVATIGGERPRVQFLDISTLKEVRSVDLPDKEVDGMVISFAADGHLQVAAHIEKRVKLFDFNPRLNERDLGATVKDFGTQLKFSRDGRLLAFSENQEVKVWEVATGKELISFKAPANTSAGTDVSAFVAFSEDSKRMATGGLNTPTIIWEADTAKQLIKLNGRTNMAYDVTFSADGNRLVSGGRTVWDLRTGRGLRVSATPTEHVFSTTSPDGKLIAGHTPNTGVIDLIEVPSGRRLFQLDANVKPLVVREAHFSADGSMLVAIYGEGWTATQTGPPSPAPRVRVWDVKTGRELRSLYTTTDMIEDARFSGDGRTIAVIGAQGQISLWETASGNKIRDLSSAPNLMPATTVTMTPGSMRNVKRGQIPNMPNMADLQTMMTNMLGSMTAGTAGRSVTSVVFSPDGRVLATGGVESKSNLDLNAMVNSAMSGGSRSKKQNTPDPDDIMKDFKVETVGQTQLWDVSTGQLITAIKGHAKGVSQIAFSRDGRILASAATDNTIKMYDVKSGQELRTLTGHTAPIESLDFSPDARLFASASEDGSTILWDANTGEHLLTLISLDDGAEWMVVTPQGLFDGTPVSWNQILWRYNQDTFNVAPIEWFFNEFYYPGLLADVTAGKRPKVAQDVSKKDRRQPVVKLSIPAEATPTTGVSARVVKVRIDVTDAPPDAEHTKGTGARDLRLFRNGSLVKVWHGDVLKGQNSITLEQEIAVTSGPNRLVAYAFNADNVKSKDAPLVFQGAETLKRKGTAYILAVGVNEYTNDQYNLKYAVADAQSFGEEVRRRQTEIGSIDRVEVITLLNQDATKANILSALKRMSGVAEPPSLKAGPLDKIKRVEPEDTVIIYFAGHGTAAQQRFYLIPHDLGYTGNREKLTEDGLKTILSHSVSDLELEDAVEGLDANHLVLVIDACNSGQALEAEEKRRGPMNSKGLAQLAYEKGMYILTAAQSFQAALEAAQLGHGLLTYALVEEGLKTPVADNEPKDGVVNAREWLDFATLRVPQMQETKMKESRGIGLEISFVEGEKNAEPDKRSVQRPRVFYRRELEANPLIVAKP